MTDPEMFEVTLQSGKVFHLPLQRMDRKIFEEMTGGQKVTAIRLGDFFYRAVKYPREVVFVRLENKDMKPFRLKAPVPSEVSEQRITSFPTLPFPAGL